MSFQMINSSRCEPRSGISGSYDTSGVSVSRNLRAVFHLGFTIHIPTKTFGGFPFLYILCSIYFWRSFWWWLLWPVEEEMATQSSILAWRIPWTGSLAGYSPWGHKESDTAERTAHTAASVRWYLTVVLLGIDLMTIYGEYLSSAFIILHLNCEYNLPLESGFLKLGPVRNSFMMIYARTLLEGRCHL